MKLAYRPKEAADVLGSMQLLDECVAAGWLKPKLQRHKLTLYDYSEIAKCWSRICDGEMPPPLVRKEKQEVAHA